MNTKNLTQRQLNRFNERFDTEFKGEERNTAYNGDLFAQDCNVEDGEVFFLYYDKDGNIYESTEEPRLRIDFSGAPVSIGGSLGFQRELLKALKAAGSVATNA